MRSSHKGAIVTFIFLFFVLGFIPALSIAGTMNGQISGTVTDPTGAVVPAAKLTLASVATGAVATTTSGTQGLFSFPNLRPGVYNLTVSATGFKSYVQNGIEVAMAGSYRVDVKLELGAAIQKVEVSANASPLNYENPTKGGGISPQTLQQLPLLVAGNPRSAIAFAILEPGITTGGGGNPYDARINGGLQSGDEALLNGISMQEGFMSQNGMVSLYQDWPMTPDMVSEVKVLTSNYDVQYGSTTGGVLAAVTKSGTDQFHAGAYEYHRNTALNARPWGSATRPKDIEHDIGAYVGGPAKLPLLWSSKLKTYFYVNFEAFRIAGGVNQPVITLPTAQERQGDFSDWKDSSGNLIPIYDPATTQTNPNYDASLPLGPGNEPFTRQQFMGCDGLHPNVICASDPRLQNSLANQWLQFLPSTNLAGVTNNYRVPTPVPDTILAQTNYWLWTADQYYGSKHHFGEAVYYQVAPPKYSSVLPRQLATETFSDPQYSFVDRFNWDYTISPTLLNHAAFGYQNRNEGYGCVDTKYTDTMPQIAGVAAHNVPPVINFGNGYQGFGCDAGINDKNVTTRPTAIVNDMLTWVRGKHQLEFGFEFRYIAGNTHADGGQSGTFNFASSETGLPGINSGNSMASFLLEQVDSANSTFRSVASNYPRQHAWTWYVGDTWRTTRKLTLTYGVRWDQYTPSVEKWNKFSFFDPLGANPGAGGRAGRLVFAGNQWGPASYGRRAPEYLFKKGFAPRIGLAYAWDPKTVIRAGYGIFFSQAFYPGWGGGMSQDGFSNDVAFSSSPYGMTPAFILSQGFPQNFQRPPFIDQTFDNGKSGPLYRPLDANRLPYAQQWNLSVEHQFSHDLMVSAGYVANKGTRLPSVMEPLNVLNPSLLSSMGNQLNDTFQSGMTSLDGVPVPYPGWVDQMQSCSPTVAQALLPYPQYCGNLQGMNENGGSSTYHSLQMKVQKRFSGGLFLLGSYTYSKLLSTAVGNTQADATTWSGVDGVISPFERSRVKALAEDDVPQTLSVSFVYDLPFGRGKHFLSSSPGVVNAVVGGWEMSSIFRASSGLPYYFRSGYCNVPGQFRMGCIPGVLSNANVFAQSKGSFDPAKGPLFNVNAFQPSTAFNFYAGNGPRISTIRGFGYHSQSLAFIKNTKITERLNFQIRAEFFNVWNWHIFSNPGEWGGRAFNNDVSGTNFGEWNGSVSDPRNIQVGARISF